MGKLGTVGISRRSCRLSPLPDKLRKGYAGAGAIHQRANRMHEQQMLAAFRLTQLTN